jgi:hypothetical protein
MDVVALFIKRGESLFRANKREVPFFLESASYTLLQYLQYASAPSFAKCCHTSDFALDLSAFKVSPDNLY